jgi:O-antigen ligase
VLVVSTALLSVYALLQSIGVIIFSWDAGLTQSARSSGTMGNANLLGSFSMAMIPVGAGFLLSRLGLSRLRYLSAGIYTFLCTGALLASKTRGSLLGIAVLLVAIPLVPSIRRNRKRLFVLLIALLVLMGISVIALSNRIEELGDTSEGTLQVRKLIWSGSLSMWLSNPVLGYGPGSFQIVFPEFRDPDYFLLGVSHNTLHAHCEYIEILVDGGIIGLLLWSSLAASVFLIVRRNRRSVFPGDDGTGWNGGQWTALGLAGGILALLAEALVSVALRWPPSALLLALFTGLLLACIPLESITFRGLKRYGQVIMMTGAAVFLALVALP